MNKIVEYITGDAIRRSGINFQSVIVDDKDCRLHVQFRDSNLMKGSGYILSFRMLNARVEISIQFESVARNILLESFSMIRSNLEEIRMFTERNDFIRDFSVFIDQNKIEDVITVKEENIGNLKVELYSNLIDLDNVEFVFKRAFDLAIPILLLIFPYIEEISGEMEGDIQEVVSNKYERSKKNRLLCLSFFGYSCQGCLVNLEDKYGSIAKNFIHVHHVNPISTTGVVSVNPFVDLIPLCPNCHSIVHKTNPPLSINELIKNIKMA